MVAASVPIDVNETGTRPGVDCAGSRNAVGYIAAGALVAGGLLLLSGRNRAGVVVATAGSALALLNHQEAVRSWWLALPVYINEVQRTINQVQDAVGQLAVKRGAS